MTADRPQIAPPRKIKLRLSCKWHAWFFGGSKTPCHGACCEATDRLAKSKSLAPHGSFSNLSTTCLLAITLSGDQRVLDGVTLIIFVVVLGVFRTDFQIFNLNIAKELNRMVFFLRFQSSEST
jgi:hypothetical protein